MQNMRVDLPEVEMHDGESLATLRVAAMRESLEQVGRFNEERARQRFLSTFNPKYTRHIEIENQKVGVVVTKPMEDHILLDHLYIHPEHQGRGIGSAVIRRVITEAKLALMPLRVGALRESRSNTFYARHGFTLIEQAEYDNYYVLYPKSAL